MNHLNAGASGCPFHAAATPTTAQARDFDMFDAPYQANPAESLRFAREDEPIFYAEKMGYWIVSRYEDVKAIFRDPITFSPCNVLEKLAPATPEASEVLKSYNYAMNRTLVNEDEPVHMARRRALMAAFEPAKLEVKRDMVRQMVAKLVDGFVHKGRANLMHEMLWEVPLVVALQFLGVPDDDVEELKKFSVAHTVNTWGRPSVAEQVHVATGVGQFWDYSGKVLQKMRDNPNGEGWMYDMIAQNRTMPDIVTDNYLHSMMMAIMVAAHETTSLASANAIKELLSRPNLWRRLSEQPELIPAAVEECLRHSGSVVAWRRQATVDTEVGGVAIPAGAKIFIVSSSANHDDRQFENPDELDIYRDNAVEHLTFGYGAHQCMGKNIGRMEMCVFIEELSRRLPQLRLAEQTFTYLPNTSFRGPQALWVEWDVAETVADAQPTVFPVGAPDTKNLTRSVLVSDTFTMADNVLGVRLRALAPEGLPKWTPGAHVELMLPDGESRKYSLCGLPQEDEYLLAIQREADGRGGSIWLHQNLRPGMTLAIKGPKNFFKLDEAAPHHLLVAGGIGITPIITMANQLRAQNKPYQLVYCGSERARMAFYQEAVAHGHSAQIYIAEEGCRADLATLLAALPDRSQVCACGPERLLDGLSELLAGQTRLKLTIEHFTPVNNLLDPEREEAFTVELLDSGLTLTVPKDQTLLAVLQAKGVDVASDCGEGLCGSCEVSVASGQVDHRDRVLSAAERKEGRLMMSCCSRAKGRITLNL
ncbi:MAG: cytochrome P450/oxidoreductase [Neisseriaceae bacterium]|nr:cytochrome P450/oxidoreductase [Neisseriaceae bacterium]